ncbi:sensor histidine kinase [Streptomyces fulvoviolaceus]|uniref:sensor histidine kinase n=1 Tax=Streptomyces fulvoviolaceus TaxID=285535 RepID=UPI0021BE9CBE|nr:nitrate- and nitrite sensing domain-containing protein [Streptomyces fulvoviolaceus]MCT9076510.1 nitrate- and nitrite sensing domain-containing protein [Streptomyces fulvoviolaceus]
MSLRTILLALALVPCLALVALGATNSAQLYEDWRTVHDRNESAKGFGAPLLGVFADLQAERRLSAAVLADPKADRSELTRQRRLTDKSVQSLQALSGSTPAALAEQFRRLDQGLRKLSDYRGAMDKRSATQQQTFDDYTGIIASDMAVFEDFSNVGFGQQSILARPALDAQWGLEMISREDAIITSGVASGHLTGAQRLQLAGVIGAQEHIYDDKVLPQLPAARAKIYQGVLSGTDWKQKTGIEQNLLDTGNADAAGRTPVSAGVGAEWQQSLAGITPRLVQARSAYSADLVAATEGELDRLMTNMMVNAAVSTTAVLLMLFISLRLTGILRRRIFALRSEALELQTRLPDLVERLRRGENVDPDAELPEIRYGDDELGQLGQALNQARSTSLETAVREVELYRGFERLLQRIARRTQLLIGMQLKRLGEMQRRHEDPEVLEGLFDLDHLAARLRRYEENLVILGNGQPQRRWRRPVLLLDVMRSAQGEVQDYRRIRIDTDGETWLSERAVGPMVHVLAELMENAVSFSRPPTPVEVTASQVGRGVAIEIEDRGMGMTPEQYAEANALMADPPRMDVMSRADDARLGLYVVARLSANLGLRVELRPSSFGGTRVVVLVPGELISSGGPLPEELPTGATPVFPDQFALHSVDRTGQPGRPPAPRAQSHPGDQEAFTRPLIGPWIEPTPRPAPAAPTPGPNPLPRRVRQASLATELREPPPAYTEAPRTGPAGDRPLPRRTGARSGATVGAFQRQSRTARLRPDGAPRTDHRPDHQPIHPAPGPDRTRKEDGR